MRVQRFMLVGAAALCGTACSPDAGPFYPTTVPLAYVRWVNAVPDTGSLDFRFVDQVENSPWFGELAFRSLSNYQGAAAGNRHIRVFPGGSTDINVVTQVVLDTTLTLVAGTYYTILQTGYARAGSIPKQHFVVMEDPRPAPGATQIAVRAVNAIVGSTLDVYAARTATSSSPVSGAPLFAGLGYTTGSSYANVAADSLAFRVATSGGTAVMAQGLAPVGHVAATISQTAQAGFSIGGSLLTAFIFPISVVGSQAPQTTAFKSAAVVWMQDNRPGS